MTIDKRFRVFHPAQHHWRDGGGLHETVPTAAPIEGLEVSDSSWGAFDAAMRGEVFDPLRTQPIPLRAA